MKISFFTFFNPAHQGGGFERFVVSVPQAMAERGHDASVVTTSRRLHRFIWLLMSLYYMQPKWLAQNTLKLSDTEVRKRLGRASLKESSTLLGLGKYFARSDVIYTKNEFPELMILRLLSLRYKLPPIIAGMHTTLRIPEPGSAHARLHNWLYLGRLYHNLLTPCTGMMVHTHDDADLIRNRFPGLKARAYIVPDFFDLDSNQTSHHQNEKFTVLFASRLTEQKGADTLCRIIELLGSRAEFSDMDFSIVGSGEARWEANLKKLGSKYTNLHIQGQVPYERMQSIITSGDISLIPSRYETFSRTCAEAQWFGLPVIASRITGPTTIIDENQTGLLVAPEDASSFVQSILKLYYLKKNRPAEFLRMAENASQRARERFAKERVINMLEDMFKEQVSEYQKEQQQTLSRIEP